MRWNMSRNLGEYFEQEVEAGPFADLMPEGSRIVQSPKLPVVTVYLEGEKWEVSDLRLLHPAGAQALDMVVKAVCATGMREVSFGVEEEMDDDLLRIVKAILMGFEWSSYDKETDKYPNYSSRLVGGITEERSKEGRTITVGINPTTAKAFHRYADKQGGKVSLYLMLKAARDELEKEIARKMKSKGRRGKGDETDDA